MSFPNHPHASKTLLLSVSYCTAVPASLTHCLRAGIHFSDTMLFVTTSAAVLCLLAGASVAIHAPETGKEGSMEPGDSIELNSGQF